MPKPVIVRRIGSLPGESHYEVDTPMGTWQVDMVQYAAGSYEGSGYGTAPRWMVTNPGEDRPDSQFDRKRDAVAYITTIVNEQLDKNGGDAVQMAVKAHQEDELHADNSPWAKVAEQHTAPAIEGAPTIKETATVTETAPRFADELHIEADADVYAPSRDAAIAAARIALDELKAKGWKSNPIYWVGRLEAALEQTLKAIDKTEGDKAQEASGNEVAEAARHAETDKLQNATSMSQGDCASHHVKDKRGGRALELGAAPTCEPGITYGAWSEGAGGFVYSGDCATEVANWAADELRTLAKEDDTDKFEILAMCPDHDEQPKDGCEECGAEGDDEHDAEQDAEPSLDDYAKASRIVQGLMPRGRR